MQRPIFHTAFLTPSGLNGEVFHGQKLSLSVRPELPIVYALQNCCRLREEIFIWRMITMLEYLLHFQFTRPT